MSISILNCKSAFCLKTSMKISIQHSFSPSNMLIKLRHKAYNISMYKNNKLQSFCKTVLNMTSKNKYKKSLLKFKVTHNILKKQAIDIGISNETILLEIDSFVNITKLYIRCFNDTSDTSILSLSNDTALKILFTHQKNIISLEQYKKQTWKQIFDNDIINKLAK